MTLLIRFQFSKDFDVKTLPIDVDNIKTRLKPDAVVSIQIEKHQLDYAVRSANNDSNTNQGAFIDQTHNLLISDFSDYKSTVGELASFFKKTLGISKSHKEIVYIDLASCNSELKIALILLKLEVLPNLIFLHRSHPYYRNILKSEPAFKPIYSKIDQTDLSDLCKDTLSHLLKEELNNSFIYEFKESTNELYETCPDIKGKSDSIQILKERLILLGGAFPILIHGERGTGKEVVARTIHKLHEPDFEFISIICSGMSATLIQSELFGHLKGAFTDAYENTEGILTQSIPKIVFLDEIADIPLGVQRSLNRFLEYGEFRKVGDINTKKIDTNKTKVIAATNEDIYDKEIFQQDLRSRFGTPLETPAVRNCEGDIQILVKHFLEVCTTTQNPKIPFKVEKKLMSKLIKYSWPDNVRGIKTWVQEACTVTKSGIITKDILDILPLKKISKHTSQPIILPALPFNLNEHLNKIKRKAIEEALEETSGNKTKASQLLKQSDNYISNELYKKK